MKYSFYIFIFIFIGMAQEGIGAPPLSECSRLLNEGAKLNSSQTEAYINLFQALIIDRNALSSMDLKLIISHDHPVNPFEIINMGLPSEQTYAFQTAFERLLKNQTQKPLDWTTIKNKLEQFAGTKETSELARGEAREETAKLWVPIEKETDTYSFGHGQIFGVFDLENGRRFFLERNANEVFLYDRQKREKTTLKKGEAFYDERFIKSYRSSSGSVWIALLEKETQTVSVFELTKDGQINLVRDGYKMSATDEINNRQLFSLWENAKGHPAIIETIGGGWKHRITVGDAKTLAFYNFDVDRGDPNSRTIMTKHGQLVSFGVNDSRKLIFRDLGNGKIINEVDPALGFVAFHSDLLSPEPGVLYVENYAEPVKGAGTQALLNVTTGKITYLPPKGRKESPELLLVPNKNGFEIAQDVMVAGTISLIEPQDGKISRYKIPVGYVGAGAQLLNLRSGKSFLFIGQTLRHIAQVPTPLMIFNLSTREFTVIPLVNFKTSRLVNVSETSDGNVEALFETNNGYKVIQVFGPLMNGAAK